MLFLRVRPKYEWQASTSDECFGSCDHAPAHTSLTEAYRWYCTLNCTGSTCPSESHRSSVSWIMVLSCLQGQVPQYLVDPCLPVSDVAFWQQLRSASRRLLVLLRHWLQTYGRWAFSVAGLLAWNPFMASINGCMGVLYAYGRIIRQKIWPKRPKLDGPAYEYAQNKMAGVHICQKIISRRAV